MQPTRLVLGMLKKLRIVVKPIITFLVIITSWIAMASVVETIVGEDSRFPGFRKGQYGWGGMIGQPISVRYQSWMNWKRAWFADFGYDLEEFLSFDANYSFYLLSEDDRWKIGKQVGTIMFSTFIGLNVGAYLGDKKEEESRLGVRGGGSFEYLLPKSRWSLRLEISPVLYLSGHTTGGVQGGIGMTYYFDSGSYPRFRSSSKSDRSDQDEFEDFDEFDDFEDDSAHEKKRSKINRDQSSRTKRQNRSFKPRQNQKRSNKKNTNYHIEKFQEEKSSDRSSEIEL